MSMWLNNEIIIKKNLLREKPCKKLGYCPYGTLVEEFPLRDDMNNKISCKTFGHDCPMFYHAEGMTENFGENKKEEKEDKRDAVGNT